MSCHRFVSLCSRILAVLMLIAFAAPAARAQTDDNGFFTEYLVAAAYSGPGCNPNQLTAADFLCDGDNSESDIIPEEGLILMPPVLEAEDCEGNVQPALFGTFHPSAPLDFDGNLPVVIQMTEGDLLNFETQAPGADNAMGYAWVYVENVTDSPLVMRMGIASDDTIQVKVNRVEVFSLGVCRGWGGAGTTQNTFPVTLQPGGNLIQFKVWDGGGGWGMRARFEDPTGCGAVRSGDGQIEVSVEPLELWQSPASRSVSIDGEAPGEVTASVSIAINAGGGSYDLEESYDRAWEVSDIAPEPTVNEPGRLAWEGITAATVSYTLSRSGAWTISSFSGTANIGDTEYPVGGATSLSSGLSSHVGEILVTPAYTMAGGVQGCNISVEQMDGPWINDADEITDETIIPEEGLIFSIDFEGESQIAGLGIMGPDQEALFLDFPGDPFSESILVRATSADGFYDFQRADIFGTDVEQVMCAAFFYAINDSDEPIRVGIGFGSDDAGTVRVNGRPVITTPRCAGHPGFTDKGTAQLDPGKNLVSVYTFENSGGYNMCIRFEDENLEPLPIPTTIDPTGYEPGEDAHPEPEPEGPGNGDIAIHDSPVIREVLLTPAFNLAVWNGCNIPIDIMGEEWISDIDGEVSDETIIPEDGLVFLPDFGGSAPEISGLTNLGGTAFDRFWTVPGDAFNSEAILAPMSSPNGIYDLQGGSAFQANVERCMCVAYTYVINDSEVGRCIQLGIGSDDSISVKVNGRPAGAFSHCAPHNPFSFKVPVWLDPGKNMIAIATYENGGGYIMCARFEDENGTPIAMPHTIDPTGYDPEDHGNAADGCSNAPVDPGPYLRGGPSNGFITEWLVNTQQFESVTGGTAPSQAFIEDYVSQNGGPPDIDSIFEGAIVETGISGLITSGVRESECGFTSLVRASGYDLNAGDPGLFNGEVYYGGGDQYTAVMFTFVNNVSDDDLQAWFGLSSDDGATLYVNGEVAVEFLTTRGFGGANEIQTRASSPAILEPGLNLIMLGYNEGGGGSGARIAMFSDSCFRTAFTEDEVSVSADNPEFGGDGSVRGTRTVGSINCDGGATVTITFSVPGDQAITGEVQEDLPENTVGENPSAGDFSADGSRLTFNGEVSDGDSLTYDIVDALPGASFCLGTVDGVPIGGDSVLRPGADLCEFSGELYINCGGPEFVDDIGRVWLEDTIENPSPYLRSPNVHTANFGLGFTGVDVETDEYIFDMAFQQDIFPAERWDDGDVIYEFTGLPPGTYEVVLLFAEFCCSDGCLDIEDPARSGGACRVFDIRINGELVRDQFAQAVEAARLLGVDPAGQAGYRVGVSVVEEVATEGSIEIVLDDLGGGNPPENAGIKAIAILATDGPAPLPDEICNNGIDDDRDGDADCDDNDCADHAACIPDEICDNGIDDDRDGDADCDDNDCVDDASCAEPGGTTFVRGDANSDGSINLTDGVVPLLFLFSGGAPPACLDAADTNDTGSVEITDAIIIFSWLFTGGAAPAEPSPVSPGYRREECGSDATDDGIDCARPSPVCQ